jgi:hypothetical protein
LRNRRPSQRPPRRPVSLVARCRKVTPGTALQTVRAAHRGGIGNQPPKKPRLAARISRFRPERADRSGSALHRDHFMKSTLERSMGASLKSPENPHFPSPLSTKRASVRNLFGEPSICDFEILSAFWLPAWRPQLAQNGPFCQEAGQSEIRTLAPPCADRLAAAFSVETLIVSVDHCTSG